ncbi:MAG: sugar phosphate isomerase/epimerase [Defluviitaleaceae bacterium]|nr:sugar phosphate isomerase/epimerase [Defluviitaleaceae bacterium]MCL2238636.1 sugar phosphate isomerase/epimerase [Defluviitaleaceae bacterium]
MLSIYHWFGFKMQAEVLYRSIKKAGFDGTTLWWGDSYYPDYRSHPGIARKAELYIESAHFPYSTINNLWLDNLEGSQLVENLLQGVVDCAEFSIPTAVMHLSSGDNPPPFNSLGLDRLKRIIEKAEAVNICVALENLRKVEYLEYALKNIGSPHCGFCFDSGHQHHRSPEVDLLSMYGTRLMALHLHDNDQTDDQHLFPFDGTIDWEAMLKGIKSTGYTGAISLELKNTKYKNLTLEEFLRTAYARAKIIEEKIALLQ